MRYRQLPLEREWVGLPDDTIIAARGPLLVETMSTKGFQIVTGVLRNLERAALDALRTTTAANPDRLLGRIQCIEEIRRSLVGILPGPERAKVDWHDDEHEGFISDPTAPDDDNG